MHVLAEEPIPSWIQTWGGIVEFYYTLCGNLNKSFYFPETFV